MCTLKKKKEKPLVTQTWVNYVALGHFSSSSRHIEKKNRYFLSKLCTQQQTRVWEHVSLIFSNFMPSQENSPNGIFPIICGFSPIRCMDPSLKKRILVKYVGILETIQYLNFRLDRFSNYLICNFGCNFFQV